MKNGSHQNHGETMQRVLVGTTGLAVVAMVIGIFSMAYSSANREEPVSAIGAANASVVANLAGVANVSASKGKDEPLAELGVAPGTDAGPDQPVPDDSATR